MNIVLIQELVRYNGLLVIIKDSISNVKKAVNGQIVMSNMLEEVYNTMIAGKLPDLWASKSYPSLKPLGSYITDLCERINFFKVINKYSYQQKMRHFRKFNEFI